MKENELLLNATVEQIIENYFLKKSSMPIVLIPNSFILMSEFEKLYPLIKEIFNSSDSTDNIDIKDRTYFENLINHFSFIEENMNNVKLQEILTFGVFYSKKTYDQVKPYIPIIFPTKIDKDEFTFFKEEFNNYFSRGYDYCYKKIINSIDSFKNIKNIELEKVSKEELNHLKSIESNTFSAPVLTNNEIHSRRKCHSR